jgi:microcystin-dependent protein
MKKILIGLIAGLLFGTTAFAGSGDWVVNGGIRVGNKTTTCSADIAGFLRFNNGSYEFCDGSSWTLVNSVIGEMKMYGGSTAPAGWLLCDGSAVSRTTYANLFAVIGTTFGAGDGSTTFNLPDLRGRSPLGAGQGSGLTSRALGQKIGAETHALSINEMPTHNHGGSTTGGANLTHGHSAGDYGHSHTESYVTISSGGAQGGWGYVGTWAGTSTGYASIWVSNSGALSHDHTIPSHGGGQAHNNMQPSTVINFIIKY